MMINYYEMVENKLEKEKIYNYKRKIWFLVFDLKFKKKISDDNVREKVFY